MRTARRFLLYGIPKSLLFKIILFLIILLFGKNVFAAEYNMNSHSSATLGGTKNRYRATEIYNTGTSNTYTFGTRYNGKISTIETYFEYPFEENTTYTLTYNMNTEDFRNNFGGTYWWDCSEEMNATNQHTGSFSYISYKKVKFTFKPTENTTCIRVLLGSTNVSSTAITGISNWRLDSITIYDPAWQSGSGSGQGSSTPSPSPSTNQDIINNQNNNTEDIINNNNENTQDIISNIQESTQQINDTINNTFYDKCPNLFDKLTIVSGDIINNDPTIRLSSRQSLFLESGTYTFSTNANSPFRYSLLIQNVGVPPLSTYPNYIYNSGWKLGNVSTTFTLASNGYFTLLLSKENNATLNVNDVSNFNYQLVKGSNVLSFCSFNSNLENKFDKFDQTLQDVKDAMTNDNVDSGTGSDFFNDFQTQDNGGISGIITKPLVLINSLLSNNDSCSDLTFGIQFPGLESKNVSFPSGCILWNKVPNSVVNLYQIFVVGFSSYFLLKRLFKDVEDLKNPEKDNVEVIDL